MKQLLKRPNVWPVTCCKSIIKTVWETFSDYFISAHELQVARTTFYLFRCCISFYLGPLYSVMCCVTNFLTGIIKVSFKWIL